MKNLSYVYICQARGSTWQNSNMFVFVKRAMYSLTKENVSRMLVIRLHMRMIPYQELIVKENLFTRHQSMRTLLMCKPHLQKLVQSHTHEQTNLCRNLSRKTYSYPNSFSLEQLSILRCLLQLSTREGDISVIQS